MLARARVHPEPVERAKQVVVDHPEVVVKQLAGASSASSAARGNNVEHYTIIDIEIT